MRLNFDNYNQNSCQRKQFNSEMLFFLVKGKHNKLNVCWGFFSWGLWDLVGSIIHSNQYKITNKFKSL